MEAHSKSHVIAAVYASHRKAMATISDIQRSRVDTRYLATAGRDPRAGEHSLGYCNGGDRMMYWVENSIFWDDLWGMLHGSAFYFVPGFGSLLVGGPIFASILEALEAGLSVGVSRNLGRLVALGDRVEKYETALRRGRYLVITEIGSGDPSNTRKIITSNAPLFWGNYPAEILRERGDFMPQNASSPR